ncbi:MULTISPECIES: fimbrial protein [Rahnella]|uniref:Fimbrial protein n=1 Tax=Rahnella laticis TaxID=2787622 RepID=A0ABS0E7F9_9GAMM|nr:MULTISPECIES: fimbrial protein [Rahnella]MBF7979199.1 fimbrial protein [Rahnella laticis]MBF7999536.1 fimbrial protein [Rahnella sp. LAC-M12]
MMFNLLIRVVVGTLFVCSMSMANAGMYVYPMELTLGQKGAAQLKLISKSDEVQFVRVTLKQIINPGTPEEKEIDADISDAAGVAVVPTKIALASGSERVVRVISMLPPEKETTWRAYFEAVDERIFNETPGDDAIKKSTGNVGVNIIWGALIHVVPQTTRVALQYQENSGQMINTGTVRLPLREIGICSATGYCRWQKNIMTVYPGMKKAAAGVTFHAGETYRAKYLDGINDHLQEIALEKLKN